MPSGVKHLYALQTNSASLLGEIGAVFPRFHRNLSVTRYRAMQDTTPNEMRVPAAQAAILGIYSAASCIQGAAETNRSGEHRIKIEKFSEQIFSEPLKSIPIRRCEIVPPGLRHLLELIEIGACVRPKTCKV